MSREEEKDKRLADLLQRAELYLRRETALGAAATSEEKELKRLVHELQVYQVELEMQNEELFHSRNTIELSRNLYADLYDFAPIPYFTIDKFGIIQQLNVRAAALLDSERHSLLKRRWISFVPPAHTGNFYTFFKGLTENDSWQSTELDIITRKGITKSVQLQAVAARVKDEQSESAGYLLTVTDITELKKAQEASRFAGQFRQIIEGMPGLYLFLSPGYKVIEVSNKYLQVLHLDRQAVIGHTLSEIYTQDSRHMRFAGALQQSLKQVSHQHNAHTTEALRYDIPLPDGHAQERYWRITHSPVLSPEGHIQYIVQHMADVTREYTAEQEVEKSRQRFEMLALASNDIIWEWNIPQGTWWWNRNIETQFGYQRAAMEPGMESWANRIHPDERDEVVSKLMSTLLSGQKECRNEYRFRRADGSYAHVLDRAFALQEDGHTTSRILGTLVDLTEIKQAEAALQESHHRFTLLLETLPQKAWIADPDGANHFYNRQWLTYTGAIPGELTGWSWQQYVQPEDLPATLAAWRQALKTGKEMEVQNRWRRAADGAYRWHMVHIVPVYNQQGKVIQCVGSLTDIHDQKLHEEALEERVQERTLELSQANRNLKKEVDRRARLEENLREIQRLTKQIVDATPDVVHVYDLVEQKTLYLSYAITDVFGYTMEDIQGMGTDVSQQLIHPDDLRKCTLFMGQMAKLTTHEVHEIEYRLKDNWGKWHWVRVRYAVFTWDKEGIPRQLIGIIHDITEKKNNEENLRQSQANLKKLNEELEARVARRTRRLQQTFEQLQREFKERLSTQQALQQSQERFQYALEKSPVILFTQDKELRYTWIHNAYHFLSGETILGKKDTELFSPEGAKAITDVTRQVLQAGQGRRQEVCLEVNGKSYYYDLTVEPLWAKGKKVTGLACAAVDITEARIARTELTRSEQRYRLLMESIPEMIFLMEPDGRLVYVNHWMSQFTGLSSAQLSGDGWFQTIHPDDRPVLQEYLCKTLENQDTYLAEVRIKRAADNAYIWHLQRMVPFKDTDGNLIRWIGISTDIHDQKLVEEALRDNAELRETQRKLQIERDFSRSLIDNSIDGIITFDTVPRYTSWNRVVEEMYQTSRAQAIGKPVFELFPGYRQTAEGQAILRVLQGEKITLYNQPYEGREGFYEINLIPLVNEAQEVIGGLGILHDVTERIKLEEEGTSLKLKQQKTLLNAILEAQESERRRIAEALHNGLAQTLYAAKLNLEQISLDTTNLERLKEFQQIVSQLLANAIKETRNISHELIPTILEDFGLKGAIEEFCQKYDHTQLTIYTEIYGFDERLDRYLEVGLYRIAQELVNNAVKHAEASKLWIHLVKGELGILLRVKDNGKGFEPASRTLKGIGLKTIQDRIKLLNGTLDIDSSPGKGTTITIKIPSV